METDKVQQRAGSAASRGECPFGHELQPWTAPAGTCHGCGKQFPDGEQVMDCRRCEWLVCEICCPRSEARSSLWGALSQWPFYAATKIEAAFDSFDLACDDFIERHSATLEAGEKVLDAVANKVEYIAELIIPDSDTDSEADRRKAAAAGSVEERVEAEELLAEFCAVGALLGAGSSNARDAAREAEALERLWSQLSLLYARSLDPQPIAAAFCRQLLAGQQEPGGASPAELRTLAALADVQRRGAVGGAIATEVLRGCSPAARLAQQRLRTLAGQKAQGEAPPPGCGDGVDQAAATRLAAALLSRDGEATVVARI